MYRIASLIGIATLIGISATTHAANCPDDSDTNTISASSCTVVGSASSITLNFVSGFTDSTSVSAVGGNPGTTVGQQRKRAFIKAASIIADEIKYTVASDTLIVNAQFSALSCSAFSAVLGSAGATTYTGSTGSDPAWLSNTFYPIGLWSQLNNANMKGWAGVSSDISANFNSDLGDSDCLSGSNGWYYGYDAPPNFYIGFVTVLLHEMTHGLGFASLVNASTGAKASGYDDIFSNNLYDSSNGAWPNLSNAQRAASATSVTGLLWDGSNVNNSAIGAISAGYQDNDSSSSFTSGDRMQMYAPSSVESGSSVSHFNTSASPDELMEPQYTDGQMSLGLAKFLLEDLGWEVSSNNTAPTLTAVDQSTDEDNAKVVDISSWGSDADGDNLTYSVQSCAANITCSISGTTLTLTPAQHHNGGTHSITLAVNDGNASTTDSFNLTVNAVNDAPTWSAIPDQSVEEGSSFNIALNNYSSDIENDSMTYSATTCGAHLTCSISTNTLTITAENHFTGTESVTVQANDGNTGLTSDSFNVTVTAVNEVPVFNVTDQITNEDSVVNLELANFATDADGDVLTYSLLSCGNGVSCLLNGSMLTLSTDTHFNGNVVISVSVSDGSASTNDSFTLNVQAVNDAPVITPLNDVAVRRLSSSAISLSASDVDSANLTFSVIADNDLNAVINGDSLVIVPDNTGTYAMTVSVSDGSLQSSTQMNVTVYNEISATTTDANENTINLNNGDRYIVELGEISLNINGGSANYQYRLDYENQNADHLIQTTNNTVSISQPEASDFNGAYAGEYVLTITDQTYNESTQVSLLRAPQISVSSTNILDKDTAQWVRIEGMPLTEAISLSTVTGEGIQFKDGNQQNAATLYSASNQNGFNQATAYMTLDQVFSNTNYVVQAESVFETAQVSITVQPSDWINVSAVNQQGQAISFAEMTLEQVENVGIATEYNSDVQGTFALILPADGNFYTATIRAEGYISESVQLISTTENYTVTLNQPELPIVITGTIFADINMDFVLDQPHVDLELTNGELLPATVAVIHAGLATFAIVHDLNVSDVKSLLVHQTLAENHSTNLLGTASDTIMQIHLISLPIEEDSAPEIPSEDQSESDNNDAENDEAANDDSENSNDSDSTNSDEETADTANSDDQPTNTNTDTPDHTPSSEDTNDSDSASGQNNNTPDNTNDDSSNNGSDTNVHEEHQETDAADDRSDSSHQDTDSADESDNSSNDEDQSETGTISGGSIAWYVLALIALFGWKRKKQ